MNRRLDIQGLRAIAVLQVVAFHAGLPVPGGFIGVDVFFVISGYVITAMLQREWASTGRIRFARFYARRFKRLTPALAVMVTFTVVASAILLSPIMRQQAAAKTAIGVMLLAANRVIAVTTGGYFDAQAETNPLLNTWSLSVEEQFYLAFPLILFVSWFLVRHSGVKVLPVIMVAVIGFLSFGIAVAGSLSDNSGNASWLVGFYSAFTRAWEFAAGALLALVATRITVRSRTMATLLGVTGIIALLGSLWLITSATKLLPLWSLIPVGGTMLLLVSGSHEINPVSQSLGSLPMVKTGDWSYSIYLWHWPLIVFAAALWPDNQPALCSAAVFSLVPAIASYVWVEQPIRSMPTPDRRHFVSLVFATVLPPIGLAAVVGVAARSGWWTPSIIRAVAEMTADYAPSDRVCMTTGPFSEASIAACQWNASAAAEPVYLVGDSDAWQFLEGVVKAAELLGRPATVYTSPSCAFISGLRVGLAGKSKFFPPGRLRSEEFDHCPLYVDFTLAWLNKARPGIVVMSALDQYWWDPNLSTALGDGVRETDAVAKIAVLRKGLLSTIEALQAGGHHVILVQSIPTFRNPVPIWDPTSCSALALLRETCFRRLPLAFVDSLQRNSRSAIEQVAGATGSTVLDLRSSFCTGEFCSTANSGTSLYKDATHVTVSASGNLAPKFAVAIIHATQSPPSRSPL